MKTIAQPNNKYRTIAQTNIVLYRMVLKVYSKLRSSVVRSRNITEESKRYILSCWLVIRTANMPSCVTEGSYNVLFIVAVIVAVLFLLSTAFYYDRFSKASTNRLTQEDSAIAKSMTILSLVVAILCIALLFILYFGFQKRLVGVYTTLPGTHAAPALGTPAAGTFHSPVQGGLYPTV